MGELLRNVPRFERLPGTRIEGMRIAAMLDTKPLTGESASKGSLKAMHSPRILHMATHGYFLPNPSSSTVGEKSPPGREGDQGGRMGCLLSRSVGNPLLRTGLVPAGANAWLQGKQPGSGAENGILTGDDASGLDLLATDLVVLSACETGLGEIKVGEGVFGLRGRSSMPVQRPS